MMGDTSKHSSKAKYTPAKKLQAVVAYATLGGSLQASKATKIPAATIRDWKVHSEWWPQVIHEVYAMQNEAHLADLNDTITHAGKELADRVKNGEYVYNKDGEMLLDEEGNPRRKKLSAHSLAVDGIAIPTDKRALITGASMAQKTDTGNLAHLENILKMCMQIGKEKNITKEVIEHKA